jgi:hypothetical protein
MRQELEWKKSVCRRKTLDQCGHDHSFWWRSLFPSSRDDCRIRGRAGNERQGASSHNWVPWSTGPDGTVYDNDCLSRFANRLGMDNPGNCTQTGTNVSHNGRDLSPPEIPKTLVHATTPSGIQPDLEFPTSVTDPSHLIATPVVAPLPPSEDLIASGLPEPLTTDIPDLQKRERSDIPLSPVRTLAETASALPTPLPIVNRAQGSTADEWSCMWDVDVTLPDSAPRMFDTIFGDTVVDEIPLVAQRIFKGELEDLSECGDVLREERQNSLTN